MKILLVAPSQFNVYGKNMPPVYPPIGLLSLAAMVRQEGHQVRVIDMDADRLTKEGLVREVERFSPDLLGLTSTTPTLDEALDICRTVKAARPRVFTVVGGIHASVVPEETLNPDFVDALCVGEGEHTIVELVNCRRDQGDPGQVAGLFLPVDGQPRLTAPRDLEPDIDSFPAPAFDLVDLANYLPPYSRRLPVAPVITSRGCPGRCTFCCSKQIFGRRYRARSAENIVAEIETLVSDHGVREIHFLDDNIATNKKRLFELCDLLRQRDFPVLYQIPTGVRADSVDDDVLRALKSINVVNLCIGVETGDETIMKKIKKDITLDRVQEAMKMAKSHGFETWAFFIIGLPGDTQETINKTVNFAIELDPDFAKFVILKPYPGSEVYQELSEAGLIDSHDYRLYGVYSEPIHHLPELSAEEILKWQSRANRKFYLRFSKLSRHLIRMGSLVRMKLTLRWIKFIFTGMLRLKKDDECGLSGGRSS